MENIDFTEDYMYETLTVLSHLNHGNLFNDLPELVNEKLQCDDIFNFTMNRPFEYLTTMVTCLSYEKMCIIFGESNITTHPGVDNETEYVSSFLINDKIVLILVSPKRGSQIRIESNATENEVLDIFKILCELYNNKLK